MTLWQSILKTHIFTLITIGLLLLSAAARQAAIAQKITADIDSFWYLVVIGSSVGMLVVTYWLKAMGYNHFVPRLWIVGLFMLWAVAIYIQSDPTDITTAYYGALLETTLLLSLVLAIALRIKAVFAPRYQVLRSLLLVLILAVLPSFLLGHTVLNQSLINTDVGWVIYPEVLAWYTYLLAGVIGIGAVLLITKGRRPGVTEDTLDLPDLTFSEAEKPHDTNLLDATHDVVQDARRNALKRGQWVSWRRDLYRGKGIIVSDPIGLRVTLNKLTDYALGITPDNAIEVRIIANTKRSQVHCVVSHTKASKKPVWPERSFPNEVALLGGATTLEQTDTLDQYILTWPLEL